MVDAVYIRVRDDRIVDSADIKEDVVVDFNGKGEIVGIEILNFSESNIDLNEVIRKGIETTVATP